MPIKSNLPGLKELKDELQGPRGLIALAKKNLLPLGEKLAKEAWRTVSFARKRLTAKALIKNFNKYLSELIDEEYRLYLEYEEQALSQRIMSLALDLKASKQFPSVARLMSSAQRLTKTTGESDTDKLVKIGNSLRPLFKVVEQSLGQGRMARAGSSSQYHLKTLLEIAGYANEFEMQQVLNGTVDFLFPNKTVWEQDRRRCMVVSMKRTIRERYKQVFEELNITKGITVYLFVTETYEESLKDISAQKVDRLNLQNVYLVVRDEIKKKRFSEKPNVVSFSEFITDELPKKRADWSRILGKK